MIARVLRFVRLPLLLVLTFAIARFALGASGVVIGPLSALAPEPTR